MPLSADQHTLSHWLSAADVLVVHVIPSVLVITPLPVPVQATATNMPLSADQHTLVQPLFAADVLAVHVIPSALVITRFPVPL